MNGTARADQTTNRRDDELVVLTFGELKSYGLKQFRRGLLAQVQATPSPARLVATG